MVPRERGTWVVIAAYHEQAHIADVVKRTKAVGYANVMVVDDGSKDRTSAEAKRAGAVVVRHTINLGKGAALKTGADAALEKGAESLVFIDGDGQHRPEEIPAVLRALKKDIDIVFTYRKNAAKAPFIRRAGGLATSGLIRAFYGLRVRDALCGMRAMTADTYRKIRWNSADYTVESEMIANAGMKLLKADEVPISTIYHDKYKGMTIFDGIRILSRLVWWRMTR